MKNIAKAGALLILLVGISLTVVGCNSGDTGMGKKKVNDKSSGVLR